MVPRSILQIVLIYPHGTMIDSSNCINLSVWYQDRFFKLYENIHMVPRLILQIVLINPYITRLNVYLVPSVATCENARGGGGSYQHLAGLPATLKLPGQDQNLEIFSSYLIYFYDNIHTSYKVAFISKTLYKVTLYIKKILVLHLN